MDRTDIKVDGKSVIIIDDVFDKDTCTQWLRNYISDYEFRLASREMEGNEECKANFVHGLQLFELEETFKLSSDIMPIIHEYNKHNNTDFKYTDMFRAHVNLFTKENKFTGHTDTEDNTGIVVLWFANPYFDDDGGGFTLGNDRFYVSNKFNRCVIFPSNMWHKTEEIIDENSVRLTVYIGFSKQVGAHDNPFTHRMMPNALSRSYSRCQSIAKQIHTDYGIGNG